MTVETTCSCGHVLRVRDEFEGRKVRCPSCATPVVITPDLAPDPDLPQFDFEPAVAHQPPASSAAHVPPARALAQPPEEPQQASSRKEPAADVGLIRGIFDFSFRKSVTPRAVKMVYALAFLILFFAAAVGILSGLEQGGGAAVLTLIVVPVLFMTNILSVRISLEFILNVARIAKNTEQS